MTANLVQDAMNSYNAGDYAAAEKAFQQLLTRDPNASDILLNLGNVYYQQERYTEAEEAWNKAMLFNPLETKAYINLGSLYFAAENYDLAVYFWEIFKQLEPQHKTIHFNLGMAYEASGELNNAFQSYTMYLRTAQDKDAIRLQRRMRDAQGISAHNIKQAELYLKQGQLKQARKAYDSCIGLMPLHPKVYQHYAMVLYKLGEREAAIRWFERAYEGLQGNSTILSNLGVLYKETGQLLMAYWAFSTAVKLNKRTPANVATLAAKLWNEHKETLVSAGLAEVQSLMTQKRYRQAEVLAQRLEEVAAEAKDAGLAEVRKVRAFLNDKRNPRGLAARQQFMMAEEYRAAGQYERALNCYRRYLEVDKVSSQAGEVRKRIEEMEKVISAVIGTLMADAAMTPELPSLPEPEPEIVA